MINGPNFGTELGLASGRGAELLANFGFNSHHLLACSSTKNVFSPKPSTRNYIEQATFQSSKFAIISIITTYMFFYIAYKAVYNFFLKFYEPERSWRSARAGLA